MVIVDSSVWVDYLQAKPNAETLWLRQQLPDGGIGLTDLILCEVLQGMGDLASFERVRGQLTAFPVLNSGGAWLAIASAENYRILRAKGTTVRKTIDCLIATFCIRHGHVLLHRDKDFDPFEQLLGLRVVHP